MPQRIILPLCDYMSGSVDRYSKDIVLENPLIWDIKRVYPKGQQADPKFNIFLHTGL